MSDVSLAISRSLEAIPLREPLLRNLIRSLQLPPGSCGLDAGCGIGHPAQLLAEAVGPAGKVAGVDLFPDVLAFGQERASRSISSGNIAYSAADVNRLPFADKSFDWVWSADCIGYPLGELAPLLGELERVLRPGGSLFLLGSSCSPGIPSWKRA
jgi:ubiquinone/menaquinone biosynthesis C-methylase UbiE